MMGRVCQESVGVSQQGKDFMVGGICRVKWDLDDQGWVCQRRVVETVTMGRLHKGQPVRVG